MLNLLDILFPQFCLQCKREGKIVCNDCLSTIEIAEHLFCPFCAKPTVKCNKHKNKNLDGLFCACDANQFLVQKMLKKFTKTPYLKSLSYPLSSLIIAHILLTENKSLFGENSTIIPMPISNKEKREIGYNPAEIIAKELTSFFKTKRSSSLETVFLVDCVFSDPSLFEEKAQALKEKGIKRVFGISVCRVHY